MCHDWGMAHCDGCEVLEKLKQLKTEEADDDNKRLAYESVESGQRD